MNGSDALLILTEWKEFASLNLNRVRDLLKYPIVIDGRNLYNPSEVADAGLIYYSVGRAVSAPAQMAKRRKAQREAADWNNLRFHGRHPIDDSRDSLSRAPLLAT